MIPRSLGIVVNQISSFQVPKSVADILVAWYCRNIFNSNYVGRAKDAFEKCKKLIGYLKYFMEEGTVIERGSTTNQEFVGRISTLAKEAENTLQAFLLVPSIASTWSKSSKPPTLSHCTVEATYKKLTYVYSNHRALFPPHRAIVDNITPPEHTVLY